MELRVRFPAKPELGRRFAEEIVVTALEDVDAIIQGFVDEGHGVEDAAETLLSFGCYVG